MFGNRSLPVSSSSFRRVMVKGNKLVKQHPLPFKALPTAIGFCFGDFLTQYMQWRGSDRKASFSWEYQRGIKMGILGCAFSYPMLLGLRALDQLNWGTHPHAGLVANSVKITLDQVVGCLLWQAAYMYVHPPYRVAAEQLLHSIKLDFEAQTSKCEAQVAALTADVRRKLHPQPAF